MSEGNQIRHLDTLDRDLGRVSNIETASQYVSRTLVGPGIAFVFILAAALAALLVFGQTTNTLVVVIAAAFGAYMALNIGANDVANNMGPAVGARALRDRRGVAALRLEQVPSPQAAQVAALG